MESLITDEYMYVNNSTDVIELSAPQKTTPPKDNSSDVIELLAPQKITPLWHNRAPSTPKGNYSDLIELLVPQQITPKKQ